MRVERFAPSPAPTSPAVRATERSAPARTAAVSAVHDRPAIVDRRTEVDRLQASFWRLLELALDRDGDGWMNVNDLPIDVKELLRSRDQHAVDQAI